ncbi:hypothetical protein SAMN05519103_09274 [Rhizobiales bacterium GAS113]|nr:hypothetical protein SAMN05519103_09274 [Rhizobiales bacterium GAS113]
MAIFLRLRPNEMVRNPASVRFPSASVSPMVADECSVVVLPPALTSCVRTVPSCP